MITPSEITATSTVVQCTSPSDDSQVANSRHALSPFEEVPVSFGNSPITTSTAAPARNPVTTGRAYRRPLHGWNWVIVRAPTRQCLGAA